MKILYLCLDVPLDPDTVATGNQVRCAGISAVLESKGHDVIQYRYRQGDYRGGNQQFFSSENDLANILKKIQPDAIIISYWDLLAYLPATEIPVILDYIAPRMLEAMYQESAVFRHESQRLLLLLPKADHFLVANQGQSDLLLSLLLLAGFNCRERIPVSIVPISARENSHSGEKAAHGIHIINAGVDWPWRNSQEYINQLQAYCEQHDNCHLHNISGAYPGSGTAEGEEESKAEGREEHTETGLFSYTEMQKQFRKCHIGLELAQRNTEREYSHSFRVIEYMQCGLPVIVNSWLPLAKLIEEFNAGWIIDSPEELIFLIKGLCDKPELMEEKVNGVKRLVNEQLSYAISCKPLLEYLNNPYKPERQISVLHSEQDGTETHPSRVNIPEPEIKVSRLKIILGHAYKLLFCSKRPDSTPDILMVTRADLFPVDHGAAVKIIRTAEALSRQGRDVYLTTDNRREYYRFREGEMSTYRFPFFLGLLCLPRIVALIHLLAKGYPMSNAFLYAPVTDSSYIVRSIYLSGRFPIGAFLAEFPAYVKPCKFARSLFGGKLLLVEHNVEYDRIKAQLKGLSAKSYEVLRRLELTMCKLADVVVTVSDSDKRKLISDGLDPEKVHTIPHGVDLENFDKTAVRDIKADYKIPQHHSVLVYHGTYSYPPNLEAIQVMAAEIIPRLMAKGVRVSVLAIGSKPPDFPLHEDIYFLGSVENLAEVIPAADIAVVLLQEGGGTRMKILDYFAAGVPVISTSKGIEGIPVDNTVQALIIDDVDEICEAIIKLIENPEEARRLAKNGRAFVESVSWDAIVRRYLPLIQ